jgi:uncharacterized protein DUF6920
MKARTLFFVALGLAGAIGFALALGNFQWRWSSEQARRQLTLASRSANRGAYDPRELAGLPPPVVRFFAATLTPGQPIVTAATLRQRGTLNLGDAAERWLAFDSEQFVVTVPPGFHWDARVRTPPGLATFVRDAYVEGVGVIRASVAGVVPVASTRGRGELARGELMRYLAEAAWVPTALLPSQGVRWTAVDDSSADAGLADRGLEVTLRFRFDDTGGITGVSSAARPRAVGARLVPTPWSGRFWNHARRNGMRIPLDAEVAWHTPAGERPYWRGHVERVDYQFAP